MALRTLALILRGNWWRAPYGGVTSSDLHLNMISLADLVENQGEVRSRINKIPSEAAATVQVRDG